MANFHHGTLGFSSTDSALVNSSNPNNYHSWDAIASSGLNPSLDGLTADANVPLFNRSRTFSRSSSVSDTTAPAINLESLAASNSSNLSISTTSLPQWAQQLGTLGYDSAYGVAVDSAGNVYITGYTDGNLAGINAGSGDAWVAKYNSSGTQQWIQQLGTLGYDSAYGVAVDSAGNIYITGYTAGNLGGTNAGGSDAWVAKYNSNGTVQWKQQLGTSAYDYAYGVAVDNSGNIYITGETTGNLGGTNAGGSDAWVAKYNSNGTVQWKQQLGTSAYDYAYGVAVDNSGNIYITGETTGNLGGTNAGGSDAWVAKYNSNGTVQWKQQLGTSAYDYAYGVAVDNSGNIYITGDTTGNLGGINAGGYDGWVAKYNSSGTVQWKQQLGTSASDSAYSVAVDSAGNIYITGDTTGNLGGTNAGGSDAWVAKYNSSGTVQWTRQVGTSAYDGFYGIAVDAAGNIYLAGDTDNSFNGDAWVVQYNSSGTLLGTQQIGTSDYDYASSIAVDSAGYVYLAGTTYSSLEGTYAGNAGSSSDAWIFAKLNSPLLETDNAGNTLATARTITLNSTPQTYSDFVGTTDTNDYYRFTLNSRSTINVLLNALTADANLQLLDSNGVALEKSANGNTGAEAIARTLDAGTYYIRVSPNGSANTNYNLNVSATPVLEWTRQLGTSAYEEAYAIAVDSAGNVYLAGDTQGNLGGTNAGSDDVWLAKYDNSGTLLWIRQFGTSGSDSPGWWGNSVAVDSAGNVYLTGFTDGNLGGTNAGSNDAWVAKYNSSGTQQWIRQFGTSQSDYSYGVAVDSAGNVYLTGDTNGNLGGTNAGSRDAWVAKYNSSGTQQWIRQFGTSQYDSSNGVAVDSAGNVYLTGGTSGNLGGTNTGSNDAWVAKYNSSGTQLWIRQFGSSQSDSSYGVAVDSAGNVYLTGDTNGNLGGTNAGDYDAWVAKYSSGGTQLWIRQFGTSQYDSTSGLAVDKAGNVYITGDTEGNLGGTNAGNDDAYVAKFSSSGTQQWIQQFGTSLYDYPYGIAVDRFNNVYIAGGTDGSLGGTSAGNDNEDAWVFAKFSKDIGGNTLATASNLGTLSGSRTYSNFIDAVGSDDYYQFSLGTTSNFNLLLSGLIADADVQLLDSNGVAVASSTNSGTEAESINTTLSAGTYYLRIYGYNPFDVDVNTTYALNLTVS